MLRNQIPPWKSRPGRGSWSRPGDAPAASVHGALWEEPRAPHCSRPLPAPRLARSPPPGICPAFPKSNTQSSKGYVTKILFNQTENQGVSPLSHFHPLPSTLWPWAPLSAFSQIQNRRATFLSYLSQEAMIEIQIKGKLLPCQLNYLAIKQFLEAFPSAESTELLVEEAWGLDLYVFFLFPPSSWLLNHPVPSPPSPFPICSQGARGLCLDWVSGRAEPQSTPGRPSRHRPCPEVKSMFLCPLPRPRLWSPPQSGLPSYANF